MGPGIVRNPGQSLVPELLTSALRKMLTVKLFPMVRLFLTVTSMHGTQE